MKIAFIALGFGVNDDLGGSAKVAQKNAVELAARGHEVVFFCTNKKNKTSDLYSKTTIRVINKVKVIYLKTYTFLTHLTGSFGLCYIPNVSKYLDREGPFDILNINEYRSYLAVAVSRWARRKSIPYTIQPQGTLIKGETSLGIKWIYDFFYTVKILEKSAMVIALTNREKLLAEELGVKGRKVRVIPNGIDTHNYKDIPAKGEFRSKYGINEEAPVVLFVGRLDPIKGIDILISAFYEIKIPECKLVIVGPNHGSLNDIDKQIKLLGLSARVILTGGLLDQKDVLGAMNDADILVVPSRAEAFGMVILEGSVLRKPMIISKNCNVSDFYTDAAMVVPLSSNKVAVAMTNLLTDKPLRERMGKRANEVAKNNFNFEKVVTQLEELFLELN